MDSTASYDFTFVSPSKQYKIYRYKFTESFMEEMEVFSKIHQFDDRKTFKEAWQKWITEFTIQPQIQSEVERLQHNGYDGDVMKKMFHSARFYFRKKGTLPTPQQEEEPLKSTNKDKTTKSTRFTKEFLKVVDEHITTILAENLKDTTYDISPATAYDDFYKKYETVICEEFLDKSLNGTLKKTYKNRFYNIKVTESSIKPFNKKP